MLLPVFCCCYLFSLITLSVSLSVCLSVCLSMFVCMYECMYVCMYIKTAGETSLSLRRLRLAMNYVLNFHSVPENPAYDSVINPNFFPTLRLSLITPQPLEFIFNITFRQLGLMLRAFPVTLLTFISPWSITVPVVRFDLTTLKNLKLIQNSMNNSFLSCLLLFLTTVRFLLMVLNAVKKLLQWWLWKAAYSALYCVGSLTILYLYC